MLLMTTQIMDQYQKDITAHSPPTKAENTGSGVNSYVPPRQDLIRLSPIDFYSLCKRMPSIIDTYSVAESLARSLFSVVGKENAEQTDTISTDDRHQQSERFETKSETFPMKETVGKSLAEEYLLEEMLERDVVIRFPPPKRYTIQLRIKSITKGKPRIIEPDPL